VGARSQSRSGDAGAGRDAVARRRKACGSRGRVRRPSCRCTAREIRRSRTKAGVGRASVGGGACRRVNGVGERPRAPTLSVAGSTFRSGAGRGATVALWRAAGGLGAVRGEIWSRGPGPAAAGSAAVRRGRAADHRRATGDRGGARGMICWIGPGSLADAEAGRAAAIHR